MPVTPAFVAALGDAEIIREPSLVRRRSRDFFWYSPILNEALKAKFAEIVARPATRDQLARCLAAAYDHDVPVTLRGGGTGNYGQAVPLDGGMVIDMTALNRIEEIGPGFIRAEGGANMLAMNRALEASGQELAVFPSTQDIATIAGFVAGGSGGIGSLAHGMLRDNGNLIALEALSVESPARLHRFEGAEALHLHHAWGLNGAIVSATVRAVPLRNWLGCIAGFPDYRAAYAAGLAVAQDQALGAKLVSTVDARIAAHFPRLAGHVPQGAHLMVAMVPASARAALADIALRHGGALHLALSEAERTAARLPHVYEFSYNHTTLQVLKSDRGVTYQQIGVPDATDIAAVAAIGDTVGEDVWRHHEFARVGGKLVAFDLPVIRWRGPEALEAINAAYAAAGFTVWDAHQFWVEGSLKQADYVHLAWKKRLDPKGLLNSGKSRFWSAVRDLPPETIEGMAHEGRMT